MTEPMFLIYALVDPRTLAVHRIGQTSDGLRPLQHGLAHKVVVLETICDAGALDDAEQWWIAYGLACGWPLANRLSPDARRPRREPGRTYSADEIARFEAERAAHRRAAALAREQRSRTIEDLQAAAFPLFEQNARLADVVVRLRLTPDDVLGLRDRWRRSRAAAARRARRHAARERASTGPAVAPTPPG